MNGFTVESTMVICNGEEVIIEFNDTKNFTSGYAIYRISGSKEVMIKLAEDILSAVADDQE